MTKLTPGDTAPQFSLQDQNNETITLESFKGRKLLLYFYPRANTPGCTRQSCSVSEAMPKLENLSIDAVGISPDKPETQKKFDEKYNLNFSLLSDPELETARAFGAFGVKNMYGKKKEGIIRSSFLIDEQGRILKAWYKVKPEDTAPKAIEALR